MSFIFTFLLFTHLSWGGGTQAVSVRSLESSKYSEISSQVRALGAKHGPKDVVVVFDIDNTLLAMNQPLGSDPWFNWQWSLLDKKADPRKVAQTPDELFRVMGILFALSQMHLTDPQGPEQIRRLQAEGYPMLVLTARGNQYRAHTERVLAENGYDFVPTAVGGAAGLAAEFEPYSLADPKGSAGISPEEAKEWKLSAPRPAAYTKGIFMTSGMHKGAMLRALLHRLGKKFDAIVFVDDNPGNVEKFRQAWIHQNVDLVVYRFTSEDATSKDFEKRHGERVTREWKKLSGRFKEVFK